MNTFGVSKYNTIHGIQYLNTLQECFVLKLRLLKIKFIFISTKSVRKKSYAQKLCNFNDNELNT